MPIYRSLPPRRRSKSGLRTKRASARKTASCGNGRGEERGLDSPPTNATRAPISSAPSVRPKARARRWRCRLPTLRRCSSISRKSAATSLSARMPCSSSIALAGTPRPISSCPRTSRRSGCLRARPNSIPWRTSASTCARIGSPTASSRLTPTSSTPSAKLGTSSPPDPTS